MPDRQKTVPTQRDFVSAVLYEGKKKRKLEDLAGAERCYIDDSAGPAASCLVALAASALSC